MEMEITKEEYFRLKKSELELNRLENGGVDNWEWYGESLNPDGEEDIEIAIENLRKEIFK